MSKEIKNQILESASQTGNPKQFIDYSLLPYALEVLEDGYIKTSEVNEGSVQSLQVMITASGQEFLDSGGYK